MEFADTLHSCWFVVQNAAPAVEDIFVEEISSSMPAEMADFTKSLIRSGLRQFKIEKDVAQHVRHILVYRQP